MPEGGGAAEERPLCPCHGEPMNKRGLSRAGVQRWRCSVEQARYNASPKKRAALARYDASPKGRAKKARFKASPKGRATEARYAATPKGRESQARRRYTAYRRRLTERIAAKAARIEELETQLAAQVRG